MLQSTEFRIIKAENEVRKVKETREFYPGSLPGASPVLSTVTQIFPLFSPVYNSYNFKQIQIENQSLTLLSQA